MPGPKFHRQLMGTQTGWWHDGMAIILPREQPVSCLHWRFSALPHIDWLNRIKSDQECFITSRQFSTSNDTSLPRLPIHWVMTLLLIWWPQKHLIQASVPLQNWICGYSSIKEECVVPKAISFLLLLWNKKKERHMSEFSIPAHGDFVERKLQSMDEKHWDYLCVQIYDALRMIHCHTSVKSSLSVCLSRIA